MRISDGVQIAENYNCNKGSISSSKNDDKGVLRHNKQDEYINCSEDVKYANYTCTANYSDQYMKQYTFPRVVPSGGFSKHMQALIDHYSKVNEENKRFINPASHIHDKYYNKSSPYYVKGLTKIEREICCTSERLVLQGGLPELDGWDPVLQKSLMDAIYLLQIWTITRK